MMVRRHRFSRSVTVPARTARSTRLGIPLLALILSLAGACDVESVLLPDAARPFEPPPVYTTWWQLVRGCSGSTTNLESVRWFTVPGSIVSLDGRRASAVWIKDGNRIVVAEDHLLRGDLIRHEMLHAQVGVAGHPRSLFLGACAGVVACTDGCVEEEMPIPVDVARVPADSLALRVAVVPSSPSASQDGGHFVAQVTATNPSPFPVLIEGMTGEIATRGFGFDLRGPTGGYAESIQVADPSSILFAPGETKSYLFDFFVGSTATPYVGVGDYLLFGTFNNERSEGLEVSIRP